ncbi:TPA: hypothetical protein QHO11_004815 [Klebsiella oxytoca]|nr:hypothetical protein [Klebsiella oxytoca]
MSQEAASWSLDTAISALAERKVNAAEYLTDLIAHEKEVGNFGAYITSTSEQALSTVSSGGHNSGKLSGIPLAVKDNIDIAGVPTTAGTPGMASLVPEHHAEVWSRLSAAGAAVLAGKASMHELAYGITGINTAFPTAHNPAVKGYLAGGSSSGTAAAVSAGLVPAGLGTDTGGSVRLPAAHCGIVGFRPTTGRYSSEGVVRISSSRDTVGLMARDVKDIMILDEIMNCHSSEETKENLSPALLTFGLPEGAWQNIERDVAGVLYRAIEKLKAAGCIFTKTGEEIHGGDTEYMLNVATLIPLAETPRMVGEYLQKQGADIPFSHIVKQIASPDVKEILYPIVENPVSQKEYQDALQMQDRLRSTAWQTFKNLALSAIVVPTSIVAAPPLDITRSDSAETFLKYIRNTAPAAVLGYPSITIPAGLTPAGCPVGIQFDGLPGHDRALLNLALRCSLILGSA